MTTIVSETIGQQPNFADGANPRAGDLLVVERGGVSGKVAVGGNLFLPSFTPADIGKTLKYTSNGVAAVSDSAGTDTVTTLWTGRINPSTGGPNVTVNGTLISGHEWADFDDIMFTYDYPSTDRQANRQGNNIQVYHNRSFPRAFFTTTGVRVTFETDKTVNELRATGANTFSLTGKLRFSGFTGTINYIWLTKISGLVRA